MSSNLKLTKKIIKSIVKECLIEVLAEGLVNTDHGQNQKKHGALRESMLNAKKSQTTQSRDSKATSHTQREKSQKKIKNTRLDDLANNITDDPILTEMLADTAHTTLQEQISAENSKQFVAPSKGDDAQRAVSNNSPEDLFGAEASGKWAQLAFGG